MRRRPLVLALAALGAVALGIALGAAILWFRATPALPPAPMVDAGPHPRVRLVTTMGAIVLELAPARAPGTVANFLAYVRDRFYDGLVIHRAVPGFVIQGGAFTPDLSVRARHYRAIANEAEGGLANLPGTVGMARIEDPHSATTQFFINLGDNRARNDFKRREGRAWGYAVFGRVVEGMEVARRIAAVPTHDVGVLKNVPLTPVVITRAEIVAPNR